MVPFQKRPHHCTKVSEKEYIGQPWKESVVKCKVYAELEARKATLPLQTHENADRP